MAKECDDNTSFHATIKQRLSTNNIASLKNEQGKTIIDVKFIEVEVVAFYKKLLDTTCNYHACSR